MTQKFQEILQVRENFKQSIGFKIQTFTRDVAQVKSSYPQAIQSILNSANAKLSNMQRMLESNHPKLKTKKGFAQISQNAKVVDIALLKEDDIFEAQSDSVVISAKVLHKKEI